MCLKAQFLGLAFLLSCISVSGRNFQLPDLEYLQRMVENLQQDVMSQSAALENMQRGGGQNEGMMEAMLRASTARAEAAKKMYAEAMNQQQQETMVDVITSQDEVSEENQLSQMMAVSNAEPREIKEEEKKEKVWKKAKLMADDSGGAEAEVQGRDENFYGGDEKDQIEPCTPKSLDIFKREYKAARQILQGLFKRSQPHSTSTWSSTLREEFKQKMRSGGLIKNAELEEFWMDHFNRFPSNVMKGIQREIEPEQINTYDHIVNEACRDPIFTMDWLINICNNDENLRKRTKQLTAAAKKRFLGKQSDRSNWTPPSQELKKNNTELMNIDKFWERFGHRKGGEPMVGSFFIDRVNWLQDLYKEMGSADSVDEVKKIEYDFLDAWTHTKEDICLQVDPIMDIMPVEPYPEDNSENIEARKNKFDNIMGIFKKSFKATLAKYPDAQNSDSLTLEGQLEWLALWPVMEQQLLDHFNSQDESVTQTRGKRSSIPLEKPGVEKDINVLSKIFAEMAEMSFPEIEAFEEEWRDEFVRQGEGMNPPAKEGSFCSQMSMDRWVKHYTWIREDIFYKLTDKNGADDDAKYEIWFEIAEKHLHKKKKAPPPVAPTLGTAGVKSEWTGFKPEKMTQERAAAVLGEEDMQPIVIPEELYEDIYGYWKDFYFSFPGIENVASYDEYKKDEWRNLLLELCPNKEEEYSTHWEVNNKEMAEYLCSPLKEPWEYMEEEVWVDMISIQVYEMPTEESGENEMKPYDSDDVYSTGGKYEKPENVMTDDSQDDGRKKSKKEPKSAVLPNRQGRKKREIDGLHVWDEDQRKTWRDAWLKLASYVKQYSPSETTLNRMVKNMWPGMQTDICQGAFTGMTEPPQPVTGRPEPQPVFTGRPVPDAEMEQWEELVSLQVRAYEEVCVTNQQNGFVYFEWALAVSRWNKVFPGREFEYARMFEKEVDITAEQTKAWLSVQYDFFDMLKRIRTTHTVYDLATQQSRDKDFKEKACMKSSSPPITIEVKQERVSEWKSILQLKENPGVEMVKVRVEWLGGVLDGYQDEDIEKKSGLRNWNYEWVSLSTGNEVDELRSLLSWADNGRDGKDKFAKTMWLVKSMLGLEI